MQNDDYSGYTINLEPITGEQFGLDFISADERATIDEQASIAAYDALLEQRVKAAYPGADVHWIDAYDRTQNVYPGVVWTRPTYDDMPDDEQTIWQNICAESSRIFDDGNLWMVEK